MNSMLRRAAHSLGRRLPSELAWKLRFLNGHHRWPRLDPPRSSSEKILWRILHDRRPELVVCTDKLAAKELVARSCPDIRVPETFWKGTDPRELVEVDLPERWVIKPNNSCGLVSEGHGAVDAAGAQQLADLTEGWTDGPHDPATAWRWPWAYSQAEQCLVVEEFVGERLGQLDWRGFVVGGELRFVLVTESVLSYPENPSIFLDQDLKPLPVTRRINPPSPSAELLANPPDGFRAACKQIARVTGLEFLRVDLLHHAGELWFGETTVYPLDGLVPYVPRSFDYELGSYWPDQKALCETDW